VVNLSINLLFNITLFLGGTYKGNGDDFDTLSVLSSKKLPGVEMHINALMTILHLNGQLKRLPLMQSAILLFVVFFIISFGVAFIFKVLKISNSELEFMAVLVFATTILIAISIYLLLEYKLWFNWFIPLILFELIEVIEFIRELLPKVVEKIKGRR